MSLYQRTVILKTKIRVENHYGVMEITGPELVETGKKQAEKFGAEIIEATVENIEKADEGITVTAGENTYSAKHVIVAAGFQ
ncbi:hypothetical protein DFO73_115126 [Cytobacillus oceanisediminis]|uniref:Pyridine nucleotide-disulfide oxidoreductase n=1 Tax=Cytobacillus oceanisediminis TaxID=665099 RepID=A0A2V2ZMB3_9BACI|nr:hypothetical protein DFO73_115126 [Cytobacillus oceanisediminis]